MTHYYEYDGQTYPSDKIEHTSLKKIHKEDGETTLVEEDELTHRFKCELCGDIKPFDEVARFSMGRDICHEHLSDEVREVMKEDE